VCALKAEARKAAALKTEALQAGALVLSQTHTLILAEAAAAAKAQKLVEGAAVMTAGELAEVKTLM